MTDQELLNKHAVSIEEYVFLDLHFNVGKNDLIFNKIKTVQIVKNTNAFKDILSVMNDLQEVTYNDYVYKLIKCNGMTRTKTHPSYFLIKFEVLHADIFLDSLSKLDKISYLSYLYILCDLLFGPIDMLLFSKNKERIFHVITNDLDSRLSPIECYFIPIK